jgi:hypothetical protein
MRAGLSYVAPLLVAGAAAMSIGVAPNARADDGGVHGSPSCGQYCGSYIAYGNAGAGEYHGGTWKPVALNSGGACSRVSCALPDRR